MLKLNVLCNQLNVKIVADCTWYRKKNKIALTSGAHLHDRLPYNKHEPPNLREGRGLNTVGPFIPTLKGGLYFLFQPNL